MERRDVILEILLFASIIAFISSFFFLWIDGGASNPDIHYTGLELSFFMKAFLIVFVISSIILIFSPMRGKTALITLGSVAILWSLFINTYQQIVYEKGTFYNIILGIQDTVAPSMQFNGIGSLIFLYSIFAIILLALIMSFKEGFFKWLFKKWHFYVAIIAAYTLTFVIQEVFDFRTYFIYSGNETYVSNEVTFPILTVIIICMSIYYYFYDKKYKREDKKNDKFK